MKPHNQNNNKTVGGGAGNGTLPKSYNGEKTLPAILSSCQLKCMQTQHKICMIRHTIPAPVTGLIL